MMVKCINNGTRSRLLFKKKVTVVHRCQTLIDTYKSRRNFKIIENKTNDNLSFCITCYRNIPKKIETQYTSHWVAESN